MNVALLQIRSMPIGAGLSGPAKLLIQQTTERSISPNELGAHKN